MTSLSVKILKDEDGNNFVPYTSTIALYDPDGETISDKIAKKLETSSLIAGTGITLIPDITNHTVEIQSSVPGANLINNLTTSIAGQGALDAYQGYVLNTTKVNISDIVDNCTSLDNNKPLSAYQGYLLNHKVVPTGGTTGQVLKKSSNDDHALEWGDAATITEKEVNSIIDNYGTKVNLQVGDKLGEKALSYEFPNNIENNIESSDDLVCSTAYDDGSITMLYTYSNKLYYRYIDSEGSPSRIELCTISNGAIGDLTNIPKFDIEEVNTNHYLYPYLFFKNQPILDRIENLEENSSKETSRLTIELDINGPIGNAGWTAGTDNIEINYIDKNGRFVSEKWYPTDITSSGEDKIIDIAKGTTFSITSTYNMTDFKKYGVCTNIQPLYKDTSSTEVTCFIYKDGSIWFWDGAAGNI